MKSERIKQIMSDLGQPNSRSLYDAINQVANEAAQEALAPSILELNAMSIYTPPFRYHRGYIWDSQNNMVADRGDGIAESSMLRIRGWGRISYMQNAEMIQDEIGHIVARALNTYYGIKKV